MALDFILVEMFFLSKNAFELFALNQKLVSSRCMAGGEIKVTENNVRISIRTDAKNRTRPDTIIELTFDQDITRVEN